MVSSEIPCICHPRRLDLTGNLGAGLAAFLILLASASGSAFAESNYSFDSTPGKGSVFTIRLPILVIEPTRSVSPELLQPGVRPRKFAKLRPRGNLAIGAMRQAIAKPMNMLTPGIVASNRAFWFARNRSRIQPSAASSPGEAPR